MHNVAHATNFHNALHAAHSRAVAKYPDGAPRLDRALSLVQDDAVVDMTRVKPDWYTVRSACNADVYYNVYSNGTTRCDCPDYALHGTDDPAHCCKHGFAVLLIRAARRDVACPKLRQAYHLVRGDEGTARLLKDGRVHFHPGSSKRGFSCPADDVVLGPYVQTHGRPY